MKMNNTCSTLLLVLSMTFINSSCARIFNRYNLTETQKYLQTVDREHSQPENYGYSKEIPIVLKLSTDLKYDKIIDAYINRLWKNGKGKSKGKLQSFNIIEKSKILNQNYIYDKRKSLIINDYSKWIYACKIISTDNSETLRLYFRLDKKNKKPYIVNGFLYGMICG